jgi:hypothetical protein
MVYTESSHGQAKMLSHFGQLAERKRARAEKLAKLPDPPINPDRTPELLDKLGVKYRNAREV